MEHGDLRDCKNLVRFSIERFEFRSHLCSPSFHFCFGSEQFLVTHIRLVVHCLDLISCWPKIFLRLCLSSEHSRPSLSLSIFFLVDLPPGIFLCKRAAHFRCCVWLCDSPARFVGSKGQPTRCLWSSKEFSVQLSVFPPRLSRSVSVIHQP
jgi:hypothetical protein